MHFTVTVRSDIIRYIRWYKYLVYLEFWNIISICYSIDSYTRIWFAGYLWKTKWTLKLIWTYTYWVKLIKNSKLNMTYFFYLRFSNELSNILFLYVHDFIPIYRWYDIRFTGKNPGARIPRGWLPLTLSKL